ncbi:Aspartyl/glutamyl-tRNA amidotransferase subunit B [Pseudomonas syringae pv. tomato]|nr:Aspartyl/glutamyl-tRNA amidotransferase subunit B [Pseudomonas syringae pv. tomato]
MWRISISKSLTGTLAHLKASEEKHMQWEVVIGLEIHTQLSTQSKIFSGSATTFGSEPNTQASLVDLGMPGVLPVLNKEAVRMAVKFGLAVDAEIGQHNVFARKNYFYPDLPKGYQISQMELPIVGKGHLDIPLEDGTVKRVGITRAHLEEDAGKSLHEDFQGMTGIDLNRAGTPLLEIVSEPDMRSAKEAVAYVKAIHAIVRYLGICDGNMAEGSLRCDCNVSIRPKGQVEFGTRCEIKNVNSFRFIEKAINSEIQRQIDLIEDGGKVIQQTRLYDPNTNETRAMRSKEEANDYRYFPDPDLLPVIIEDSFIEETRATLPELPPQKRERFQSQFGLSTYDASVLASSREQADYFEKVVSISGDAKLAANWVMVELGSLLNKQGVEIDQSPVSAEQLGGMLKRITDNTISGKIAKMVFEAIAAGEAVVIGEGSADEIIERKGLKQVTDSGAIESMLDEVLAANAEQVEQYRAADEAKRGKMFGFFVGQAMKASKGKANPQQVNELLKAKLEG